jgi:hypothetical protein
MRVAWDPRSGPDKERSGLLRIGRDIATSLIVSPCELSIRRRDDGIFVLDRT